MGMLAGALALGVCGCAPAKTPADLEREAERRAVVDKVIARLKQVREGRRAPEVMEGGLGAADDDAQAAERGECKGDDCIKRFMRHAMYYLQGQWANTIVTGWTVETGDISNMRFPPDVENIPHVRVVVGVIHPPKGESVYRVMIGAELIGKSSQIDFNR
jgi:hypothetical protein